MDFFNDCKNDRERRSRYHKLAKLFHPDRGGDSEIMMELTRQYEGMPSHYEGYTPQSPHYNRLYEYARDLFSANQDLVHRTHVLRDRIKELEKQLAQPKGKFSRFRGWLRNLIFKD